MYHGTAPLFVTCKELEMAPLLQTAEHAIRTGVPSDATMLLRRMRRYHFSLPMPVQEGVYVQECGCCFSRMVLEASQSASIDG